MGRVSYIASRNPIVCAVFCCVSFFAIFVVVAKEASVQKTEKTDMESIQEAQPDRTALSTGWPPEHLTHKETGMPYILFKPPSWSSESAESFPLIVFLHGAGESGSNSQDLLSEGATGCPPVELASGRADPLLRDRFLVAAPQTNRGWDARGARVAAFVDSLVADRVLRVDAGRVYCTGVSMGGYGCWAAGASRLPLPDGGPRFAAIAPVCGAGQVDPAALGTVPVWAFHGANDGVWLSWQSKRLSRDKCCRHGLCASSLCVFFKLR